MTEQGSCRSYSAGNNGPRVVWKRVITDLDTPVSAAIKLQKHHEFLFLLESVMAAESRGRYSVIALDPNLIWKCENGAVSLSEKGGDFRPVDAEPISHLKQLINDVQFDLPDELPPYSSGLIGYLSYDAVAMVEPAVKLSNPDNIGIPTGIYVRPRQVLVFDSVFGHLYVVYTVWPSESEGKEQDIAKAEAAIDHIIESLKTDSISEHYSTKEASQALNFSSNFSQDEFESMVETCKDYINAGDIFQIVPSQRFQAPFETAPFNLYRSLRQTNPSPFLFYLQFGDFQLIGSSPEILVRLRDDKVTIRPLAGTRPRGKDAQEDKRLASELLADQKEVAEHLMLVDLSRHDVGRVSKPGTVRVTEQMIIEYYSHVMHISSNVEGELDPQYDALDALLSGLPLGTVSGAPKIRAMQIIDELEPDKRSFYAGCVGFFSTSGQMDTCVTLRTALIKDKTLFIQSGCGVVADSVPRTEYEETMNKAKALMKAAEHAQSFES